MKSIVSGLAFVLMSSLLTAQELPELWTHRIEIFESELNEFIESSLHFREDSLSMTPEQQKDAVDELMLIAGRISHIYFESLHLDEKHQFDASLKQALRDYREIRVFFYLIGNRFVMDAKALLESQDEREKRFVLWSTVGGGLLGLAGGSALIYFRALGTDRLLGKVVALALVTGGGAALGHFGGRRLKGVFIPVDPDVQTASDFLAMYPEGQDFINSISIFDLDVNDHLSGLEEKFHELF